MDRLLLYESRTRLDGWVTTKWYVEGLNDARTPLGFFSSLLARTLHEDRREAFETEAQRG